MSRARSRVTGPHALLSYRSRIRSSAAVLVLNKAFQQPPTDSAELLAVVQPLERRNQSVGRWIILPLEMNPQVDQPGLGCLA